jgi:hypothetical protein
VSVVDIEPTDKDKNVTKIGKDVYQTADQAEREPKGFAKMQSRPINLHRNLDRTARRLFSMLPAFGRKRLRLSKEKPLRCICFFRAGGGSALRRPNITQNMTLTLR